MASSGTLRRNPKRGRIWHRPERKPVPRKRTRRSLEHALYGPGGPKDGIRRRRDVLDNRMWFYERLLKRARGERTGRFATTTTELIKGHLRTQSRSSAKPWKDWRIGQPRRAGEELLRHHYATVVASWLDDLEAIGWLRWGGVRDNNGLWWRLEIELLAPGEEDPAEPPSWPDPGPSDAVGAPSSSFSSSQNSEAPFGVPPTSAQRRRSTNCHLAPKCSLNTSGARTAGLSDDRPPAPPDNKGSAGDQTSKSITGSRGVGSSAAAAAVREPQDLDEKLAAAAAHVQLAAAEPLLADLDPDGSAGRLERLRELGPGERAPVAWLEEALATLHDKPPGAERAVYLPALERALARWRMFAVARPLDWPAGEWAALTRAVELYGGDAASLVGVIVRFDQLTHQVARAHGGLERLRPAEGDDLETVAGELGRLAAPYRAQAELERERWYQLREAGRQERLAVLRALAPGAAPPIGWLEEAMWTIHDKAPKHHRERHAEKLALALRRYRRYAEFRPTGWPVAEGAALVDAIEAYGGDAGSLAGVIAKFLQVATRMRAAHKFTHWQHYDAAARKRAEKRRRREAALEEQRAAAGNVARFQFRRVAEPRLLSPGPLGLEQRRLRIRDEQLLAGGWQDAGTGHVRMAAVALGGDRRRVSSHIEPRVEPKIRDELAYAIVTEINRVERIRKRRAVEQTRQRHGTLAALRVDGAIGDVTAPSRPPGGRAVGDDGIPF